MGSIVDALFGGSAGDAADAQIAGMREAQEALEQARAEAQQLMQPRFDEAMDTRRQGTQQALDIFRQGFDPSLQTFQQGSMLGQGTLQTGAQQAGAAILGGPIDYNALNPQAVNIPQNIFTNANVVPPPQPDIGVPPPLATDPGTTFPGDEGANPGVQGGGINSGIHGGGFFPQTGGFGYGSVGGTGGGTGSVFNPFGGNNIRTR